MESPKEYRQAYEVLKKKRAEEFEVLQKKLEEENMQEFNAKLKKDLQYVKSLPPCSNNVEPSTTARQEEEASLNNGIHEDKDNDSASMVSSVIEKAESESTCAESIESKEASFVEQEHGECETTVLDFSGCKGAYLLPYELRAKEIDDNEEQENIAEQRSVDKEHQSEEAQDPENKYHKALEKPTEEEQDGAQVIQPSCYSNVSHKVHLADNLLALQFGQNNIFDASISKFLISYERPIKKSNLFVSNMIIPKHIGHHVVTFRETDSDKLLQPKLSSCLI